MTEDDEDFEDKDDDIRSHSPLTQQFTAENFWQDWQWIHPPVPAAAPQQPIARPAELAAREASEAEQVEQPEGGLLSVSLELEESVPSTSGLSSSTKRSREESDRAGKY